MLIAKMYQSLPYELMQVKKIVILGFLIMTPIFAFELQEVKPQLLPMWETLHFQKSLEVFRTSCHLKEVSQDLVFAYSADELKNLCSRAKSIKASEAKRFFETHFMAYKWSDKTDTLMTAYYAPTFAGSLKQTEFFRYPVYGPPNDLREFRLFKKIRLIGRFKYGFWLSYPKREEIMEKGLVNKAKAIAWLKDPLDLLELEIQGSGAIQTSDQIIYLNYTAENGHPYYPIGKFLITDGKIAREKMSMQAIRDYFIKHPSDIKYYLYQNPSYVFFKEVERGHFYGYKNIILTSGYSLAIDKSLLPMGLPIMIDTQLPDKQRFSRLMVAQDTGGAIKGLNHLDIYLGQGLEAQNNARKMQAMGQYWVLLPKKSLIDDKVL